MNRTGLLIALGIAVVVGTVFAIWPGLDLWLSGLFYDAAGGPPVSARADEIEEIARIAEAHWRLGGNAVVVGRPPTESLDVAPLIEEALATDDEMARTVLLGRRISTAVCTANRCVAAFACHSSKESSDVCRPLPQA